MELYVFANVRKNMVLLAFINKIKNVEQLLYKLLRICVPFPHHLYLYSIYVCIVCVCDLGYC